MLIITLSVVWAESVKQLMREYNKRTNLYAIFKFLYSFSMYITLLKKNIKISSIKKSATYNYLLYLLFIFLTISNIPANISRQVAITASSCQLVKSSNTLANIVRKET